LRGNANRLDLSNPGMVWQRALRRVLYFGGHDGRLISLALDTGNAVGCFTAGRAISASPALLPDGSVVFAAEDGYVPSPSIPRFIFVRLIFQV
jgi:hypothetical protein